MCLGMHHLPILFYVLRYASFTNITNLQVGMFILSFFYATVRIEADAQFSSFVQLLNDCLLTVQ